MAKKKKKASKPEMDIPFTETENWDDPIAAPDVAQARPAKTSKKPLANVPGKKRKLI